MEPKNLKRSSCSVPQCGVNKKLRPEVAFFRLPKNPERAQLWLKEIGAQDLDADGPVFVCEEHFEPAQMNRTNPEKRKLMLDAVPKLKLPKPTQSVEKTTMTIQPKPLFAVDSEQLDKLVQKIKGDQNIPNNINNASVSQFAPLPGKAAVTYSSLNLNPRVKRISSLLLPSTSSSTSDVYVPTMSVTQNASSLESNKHSMIDGHVTGANVSMSTSLIPGFHHTLSGMIKGAGPLTLQIHAIQTQMQQLSTTNRRTYLQLSLKLYLRFPKAYKHLQKALGVSKHADLKDLFEHIEESTNIFPLALYLKQKTRTLTEKQKQCFVSIGETKIKPLLYYDIKNDVFLGIHDYDNVLKLKPATTAVVLVVQGIFHDWKQPIAIAYLSDDAMSIKPWVTSNIAFLIDFGYHVEAVVCQTDSHHYLVRQNEYLYINSRKIPCFYDIMSLMKTFYFNFTKVDYDFDSGSVKSQDIIDFYKSDSQKEFPLHPKLSDKHVYPAKFQDLSLQSVMEVCSMTTAAAMSAYVEFGVLDESAKETVQFIVKMSKIFDILNAGQLNDQRNTNKDFAGSKTDTEVNNLTELLALIESSNVKSTEKTAKEIHGKLIEKFKIFESSISQMSESINDLPLWRFTAAAAELFFEQVRMHSKSITEPTAKDVNSMFKQTAIIHLLKTPVKDHEPIDINKVLTEFQILIKGFKTSEVQFRDFDKSGFIISSSEYKALELESKNGIIFLAGFLLKKSNEFHTCPMLDAYIYTTSKNVESLSRCESIMDDVRNGLCNVPSADFIDYVESMEIVFRTFVNKEIMSHRHILASLLSILESVDAALPCKCFPVDFVKKLYVRFRIYHTLKYNNELIKSKIYKRLVVNKL